MAADVDADKLLLLLYNYYFAFFITWALAALLNHGAGTGWCCFMRITCGTSEKCVVLHARTCDGCSSPNSCHITSANSSYLLNMCNLWRDLHDSRLSAMTIHKGCSYNVGTHAKSRHTHSHTHGPNICWQVWLSVLCCSAVLEETATLLLTSLTFRSCLITKKEVQG